MALKRPNILLITADQWRGDCLGVVGHPTVRTPHLDRFARDEATVFARHYAGCAPCSPARASLYTGLQQMSHRVVRNGTPLDARFDNIALAARRAGYRPTLFGYTDTSPDPRGLAATDPTLQTYEGVLPGFEVGQGLPEDDGPWLDWLAERGHDIDTALPMQAAAPEPGQRVSMKPTRFSAEESQTAFLTDAFLDWLPTQEAGQEDAGWFAHLSFLRPHPPFSAPAPFNDMYDPDADLPYLRADSADAEPDLHPLASYVRNRLTLQGFVAGAEQHDSALEEADFDRIRAVYYGMISEVDAQMGRLLDALRDRVDWDNTLVVFTSDHAEMMGDHYMLGKGGYYEQSYHIPLMIKMPGHGTQGVQEELTSAIDVFPTLLDALGIEGAHVPNGRSLLPYLKGTAPQAWRDGVIWEYDFRDAVLSGGINRPDLAPDQCVMVCYRSDQHLYVHSAGFAPLLFDLENDPACMHNIADTAPDIRIRMAESLLAERARCADQTLARHMVWDWHTA
jgi:arylsulfatase A-like enzyme